MLLIAHMPDHGATLERSAQVRRDEDAGVVFADDVDGVVVTCGVLADRDAVLSYFEMLVGLERTRSGSYLGC